MTSESIRNREALKTFLLLSEVLRDLLFTSNCSIGLNVNAMLCTFVTSELPACVLEHSV